MTEALTPQNWPQWSALLDEALELPLEQRQAWLDALPPPHQAQRPMLALMLAQAEAGTLAPSFQPAVASATAGAHEGSRVGPYRLRREIGRGGMGSVWEAERDDDVLQRTVALKLPHAWLNGPGLAARMARERNILARLAHPHIARLYDAGLSDDGRPYMAMELVEGEPLADHCDARRLTVAARLALFLQVLDAVQYAHERLVIHRDLKPGNILVTPAGQAMLLDFGIAKLLDEGSTAETELTRQGGRLLTPAFASPEQILGQPLTTASDVYSLGRVLYELLVGQRPFVLAHDTPAALEQAVLSGEGIAPSQARVEPEVAARRGLTPRRLSACLAGDLDTILGQCLKLDPAQRYPTVSALRDDLQRHLDGEPVRARPDSRWYRARKFMRRHRLALGAATAVFTAVGVGLGVALWQASLARQEAWRSALEANKAEKIKRFMIQVFESSDPNGAAGRRPSETTAVEILDAGARQVEQGFADEPEVREALRLTLAGLYEEIGLPERALPLCEQVVRSAGDAAGLAAPGATLPAPSAGLADAWRCLGMAREGRDKAAALQALERAEAVMQALGDRDSVVYAQVITLKAGLLREHGSSGLAAARDLLRGVLPAWQHHATHQGHAYAWSFLGDTLWQLGERQAAVEAFDRAVSAAAAMSKPVVLADMQRERALAAMRLGDLAGAEATQSAAVEAMARRLGEDHWRTLSARCDLGQTLAMRGRREQALPMIEQATAAMAKVQPGSDPLSICLSRLGTAYQVIGRADLALAPLGQAEAILRTLNLPRARGRLLVMTAQGQHQMGQVAAARAALREAAMLSGESWAGQVRLREAEFALRDGDAAAAVAALQAVRDRPGATPTELSTAQALQAEAALPAGDAPAALALAREALQAMRQRGLQWVPGLQARLQLTEGRALCASLPAAGGGEDGADGMRSAVQALGALHDPASPELALARLRLADCLLRLGRPAEAAGLAREAEQALRAHRALHPSYRRHLKALLAALQPARSRAQGLTVKVTL